MSNLILEKNWILWMPKKILLNKKNDNLSKLYYNKKYINKNLYSCEKSEKNILFNTVDKDLKNISNLQKEAYNQGFKKGYQKYKSMEFILKNKVNKLFLDFEKSLFLHEKLLFTHLLKTILTVSAYVIGHQSNISENCLLTRLKKIIKNDGVFLKKPQLVLHPDNKKLEEKIFSDCLKSYNWKITYNKNVDLNSCQVLSESGNIDATIDARWKELFRLIHAEEH